MPSTGKKLGAKMTAKAGGLLGSQNRPRYWSLCILGYFALVFALISISSFVQKSPAVDEPLHLFAGYSYLKWHDFRVNPVHPPFAKIWAALPLLAFDIKDPRPSRPQWDFIPEIPKDWSSLDMRDRVRVANLGEGLGNDVASDMLFVDNDGETLIFCAKLQMVFLAIILGAFVYLCSKRLFGIEAAVASLFIYALDPNILAHSQIIHTDIPFAAFFFIGTYFFWRFLSQATWSNVVLAALFFGLAAITKHSYPVILVVWSILGLVRIFLAGSPPVLRTRWQKAGLLALVLGCASATAYAFIWAAYGLRFAAIPGGLRPLSMELVMPPEESLLHPLAAFFIDHHIFPEAAIYGQLFILQNLGRVAYLFGEVGDGFWSYFPVAFAVKTPLPMLALLVTGAWMLIRRRIDRMLGLFFLAPVIIYFSSAVVSRMNIGLRHILPIYPFLFVFTGAAVAELWKSGSRIQKGGVVVAAVWYLAGSISTYPDYLAFFNEAVGGPKNGHKVLLDSNLDWGQDLKGLKRWMDGNGVKKIRFLYFGSVDPEYYGIDASYLPGSGVEYDPPATQGPEAPRYVAMSAHLLYTEEDKFVKPFRTRKPVAAIGHSILIFDMNEVGNRG